MKLGHEAYFTIRTYESDHRKQAKAAALVRLMHEAAMQNVLRLKLSVWDLEPHRVSWVLMRQYLHINRLPRLNERIRIQTYPAGFEKFFTYRDYKVFAEHDELIAHSSSTWLLMDTQTRRMTRIPDFILTYQEHVPPKEACLPRATSHLPAFERADQQKNFKVHWHDLDWNMHLNNALYIQWMLETVPDELLQSKQLEQLKIIFKMEGLWKESLAAEMQQLADFTFLHRLIRTTDGKELASMLTTWSKSTLRTF